MTFSGLGWTQKDVMGDFPRRSTSRKFATFRGMSKTLIPVALRKGGSLTVWFEGDVKVQYVDCFG